MITLRGYFGHGNVGDETLLTAFVEGLLRRGAVPSDLHVLSRGSALPTDVQQSYPRSWRAFARFLNSKALIFSGGGIIQDHVPGVGTRQLKRTLLLSRAAKIRGMKVCFHAISIGPLTSNKGIDVALRIFRLSNWTVVRDSRSMDFLEKHGIQSLYSPDLSVLLGTDGQAAVPPTVRIQFLFVPCGSIPLATNASLWSSLSEVAEQKGIRTTLCSFHEGVDDAIVRQLAEMHYAAEIVYAWKMNPRKVVNLFKAYSHVVSVRLHGGWFAYLAARPLIQVIYHPKCLGFLETVQAPRIAYLPLCDLADNQKLVGQLGEFISKNSANDSYYGSQLEDLQQQANESLDGLYEYLVKNRCVQ